MFSEKRTPTLLVFCNIENLKKIKNMTARTLYSLEQFIKLWDQSQRINV